MKTSTIDKLKEIISAMHRNIGRRCDGTNVNLCIDKMFEILDKETQRKEHKRDTINLLNVEINILKKRITEIENPKFQPIENTAHDEIYQRGYKQGVNDEARRLSWPFGVRQQSLFGFELSPTNKIIINNGVEFKRLLDMFNEAYEKQCNRK